jgi:hypothetical protein
MAAARGEQLNVLCERYLEIVLADRGNTLLLLLQAPIIAIFTVVNWQDVDAATNSLYYLLAFSALWFGTSNACREVVKESAIFDREARLGLEVGPYLLSKCLVLALLSFVQCLCLAYLVNRSIPLGGPVVLHFVYLWLASLSGICLGLLISCLMSNSDKAVGAVVLVLIPQMVFSEMVLSHEHASKLVLWLEDLSFISWTFQGLKEVTKADRSYLTLLQSASMISLLSLVLLAASYALLKLRAGRVRC